MSEPLPDFRVHPPRSRELLGAAAATKMLAAEESDICFLTATEMAELIRRKKLSARETDWTPTSSKSSA